MKKEKKRLKIEPKFYTTIDREEIYLNEMCRKGWKPTEIFLGVFFVFRQCEPGEYLARVTSAIDADSGRATRRKRQFLAECLTESGAEIVHETNIDAGMRIYAVRPAALGDFDINTDADSLIADCRARRRMHVIWSVIAGLMFLLTLAMTLDFLRDALRTGSPDAVQGALVESACSAFLLLTFVAVALPVRQYSQKLRELREKREIEE